MIKRSTTLILFLICFAMLVILQSYYVYTSYKLEEKIINKEASLTADSLLKKLERLDNKTSESNILTEFKILQGVKFSPQEKLAHINNWYKSAQFYQLKVDSILNMLTETNKLDIAIRNEINSIYDVNEKYELLEKGKTLIIFKSTKDINTGYSIHEGIWNSFNREKDTELELDDNYHLIVKSNILIEVLNINAIIIKKILPLLFLSCAILIIIAFLFWRSLKNIKIQSQKISQLHTTVDSIAHALNTPLTTLKFSLANGYNAQSKPLIDRQINRIETIISAINQTSHQDHLLTHKDVDGFLTTSKINYGSYFKEINLNFNFNHRLLKQDFEIILNNLIENAVKYGAKQIQLNLNFDKIIQISISDDGIGIPKDSLPHIFDKYYRVSRNENLQINGLGIGLHLVKNIVDTYGGKIQVSNNPTSGVTFIIYIAHEN